MESRAGWKWYGFPGHFVGGADCAFHLATRVGNYLVSTVGAYRPRSGDGRTYERLGAGDDSFFETFVFACSGEDGDGNPVIDYSEVDGERYADSRAAEDGHYLYCERYAERA